MAISFRSSSSDYDGGGDPSVSAPTGIQDNDLLIAVLVSRGGECTSGGLPVLCADWAEGTSCHPNEAGRQRLASALWVMLARLAEEAQ